MLYDECGCFSYPISSYTYLLNFNKKINKFSDDDENYEKKYYSKNSVSTLNKDGSVLTRVIENNNGNIERYEERYNIPKRKGELKNGKHIRWLD